MNLKNPLFTFLERWAPLLTAVAFVSAYWWLTGPLGSYWPKSPEQVISTAATVAAMSVGFLGTAKGVLFSLSGSRVMRFLREGDQLDPFLRYVTSAIWSGSVLAAISIFALFLPLPSSGSAGDSRLAAPQLEAHWTCGSVFFVGLVGWCIAAYARAVLVFSQLLRLHLMQPADAN